VKTEIRENDLVLIYEITQAHTIQDYNLHHFSFTINHRLNELSHASTPKNVTTTPMCNKAREIS